MNHSVSAGKRTRILPVLVCKATRLGHSVGSIGREGEAGLSQLGTAEV